MNKYKTTGCYKTHFPLFLDCLFVSLFPRRSLEKCSIRDKGAATKDNDNENGAKDCNYFRETRGDYSAGTKIQGLSIDSAICFVVTGEFDPIDSLLHGTKWSIAVELRFVVDPFDEGLVAEHLFGNVPNAVRSDLLQGEAMTVSGTGDSFQ